MRLEKKSFQDLLGFISYSTSNSTFYKLLQFYAVKIWLWNTKFKRRDNAHAIYAVSGGNYQTKALDNSLICYSLQIFFFQDLVSLMTFLFSV